MHYQSYTPCIYHLHIKDSTMHTKEIYASSVSKIPVLISLLLAFVLAITYFSPLCDPKDLELPPLDVTPTPDSPWNNRLQTVTKLREGILNKPEDIIADNEGTLVTATRDGWIWKMPRNGTWETWKKLGSDSILGIAKSATPGNILVCDAASGLLMVNQENTTVLASHVSGTKINFANIAIEASDGTVYFSDTSSKFGLHEWYLDVLEARPHGRLLKYDPTTMETSIVLDGLAFANGVALSEDEEFLLISETWKFRVLKYYLNGAKKGQTEIFVDKLPGGPDNIHLAPDGTFWIACVELRLHLGLRMLDFVHKSKFAKHFLATFPKLIELTKSCYKKAMVVNVGVDGLIIKKFDDSTGDVMSFASAALELDNHLYIGSLNTNFIGKLQLSSSFISQMPKQVKLKRKHKSTY